jgi:DNA-binding PadR family transcriptional regulator
MPRSADDFGAGEWAVLALLCEQPTHGFAVARAMAPDGEIGKIWSVRRPLVYRAIDILFEVGFARPTGTVPSPSGPRRTVVEATPAGRDALESWLALPVGHVRDARSLLMLKLLFLSRRDQALAPLLSAQREAFQSQAQRLTVTALAADGFDRVLVRWRLEATTAAIRFIETMLEGPGAGPAEPSRPLHPGRSSPRSP